MSFIPWFFTRAPVASDNELQQLTRDKVLLRQAGKRRKESLVGWHYAIVAQRRKPSAIQLPCFKKRANTVHEMELASL